MTRVMRTVKVCLALVAMAALPACSLINAPKQLPPEPHDAGRNDGGGCRSRETCFNGVTVDDDCDGVTDCDDLDCANDARCCAGGAGTVSLSEPWTAPDVGGTWTVPANDFASTFTTVSGIGLTSFGADGVLRSLMPRDRTKSCVPLALGARVEVYLHGDACTGACTDEAAVLLTGATVPVRGAALAADLRVSVTAGNTLHVTSGTTELVEPTAIDPTGRVVIDISSSVQDGVAVLAASVLTGTDGLEHTVASNVAFIAQSLLRACPGDSLLGVPAAPGLSLAVEGRGSSVTVGPLTVSTLGCTNPNVFSSAGEPITASDVGAADDWAAGGFSAPALLPYSGTQRLFYDAAKLGRDLEETAPIDFSIGAAEAPSFTSPWAALPTSPAPPYLTRTPPTCAPGSCVEPGSVREPTASATYQGTRFDSTVGEHILAFARATAIADVYDIAYVKAPTGSRGAPPSPQSAELLVAPSEACVSVRDPALAQADERPAAGLWLFYTCVRTLGPSTIRATALEFTDGTLGALKDTDVEVLGPGIGAYAANGVSGSAALVRAVSPSLEFPDRKALAVRLWFVARGLDGRRSLALAEGQVAIGTGEDAATLRIPALQPYPANPLLYGNAPELGTCDGTCILRDVAIGRLPNSTALTVLVARSVDLTVGGTEWQLIPLSQTLEQRWWGTP